MDMSKHKELIDISNLFEWAYRNGNSQKMVECAWEFEKDGQYIFSHVGTYGRFT